jgi:hypothetical protein
MGDLITTLFMCKYPFHENDIKQMVRDYMADQVNRIEYAKLNDNVFQISTNADLSVISNFCANATPSENTSDKIQTWQLGVISAAKKASYDIKWTDTVNAIFIEHYFKMVNNNKELNSNCEYIVEQMQMRARISKRVPELLNLLDVKQIINESKVHDFAEHCNNLALHIRACDISTLDALENYARSLPRCRVFDHVIDALTIINCTRLHNIVRTFRQLNANLRLSVEAGIPVTMVSLPLIRDQDFVTETRKLEMFVDDEYYFDIASVVDSSTMQMKDLSGDNIVFKFLKFAYKFNADMGYCPCAFDIKVKYIGIYDVRLEVQYGLIDDLNSNDKVDDKTYKLYANAMNRLIKEQNIDINYETHVHVIDNKIYSLWKIR